MEPFQSNSRNDDGVQIKKRLSLHLAGLAVFGIDAAKYSRSVRNRVISKLDLDSGPAENVAVFPQTAHPMRTTKEFWILGFEN
ncbi:MAG: hypothetical protein KF851_04015 [Pirellulaceae bacterium]|nr:hypothetical protein [Pirellulaceae bacterium]